jgi:hypothetical protein
MTDTALDGRPISRTMMCYTVSAVDAPTEYENSPTKLYRKNQRNSMFCPHGEGPGIEAISANNFKRTQRC